MKKLVLVFLLFAGAASLFSNSNTEASEGNNGAKSEFQVSDKPVTFSFFSLFAGMPFDPDWEVWQEIAKTTNVKLENFISTSASDEIAAYNMMLSSGMLADIIAYRHANDLEKLGQDGGLIPLNDLIDEHAPNIKAFFEDRPEFKKMATSVDGNIYFMPKYIIKKNDVPVSQVFWIRKDWLEAVNREVPTNMNELYDVLTAFRNEDPNGNGLQDEIPYFDRDAHWFFDNVLYMWDASSKWYGRDGKITFGPLEDEFSYGIKEAAKWYKEGLIDPEIFTRGGKSRDILFGGNLGGMTHDWTGSTTNYNEKLKDQVEGFEIVPMLPVANQKGEVINRTYRYPMTPGWGISSQCEDPVTAIKFFDFFFSKKGHDLMNFGIEGNSYTVENDEIKYTDKITKTDGTALKALRSMGVQYRIGMVQDYKYEDAMATETTKVANELYAKNIDIYRTPVPSISGDLALRYTEEEGKEYKKIMTNIQPYVQEMVQKWVIGISDFDSEYEDFVKELKARGIDRAIEINQIALERFQSN